MSLVAGLVLHESGTPNGPELVLLHGLTEACTTWPDAVDHSAADWRTLAPDLRGHGASPRFSESQLGSVTEVLVADVIALLESVCRGPAVLLARSLGDHTKVELVVFAVGDGPDLDRPV